MDFYYGEKDKTAVIHDKDLLRITSCGIQSAKRPYRLLREHGRKDFHLVYVQSGTPVFEYENRTYALSEGDFILYAPGQRQAYTYSKGTKTYWVHFYGTWVTELFKNLALDFGIHRGNRDAKLPFFFQMVLEDYEEDQPSVSYALLGLLSMLARSVGLYDKHPVSDRFTDVLYTMNASYTDKIDIKKYAEHCHVSVDRFNHVFRQKMGISPYQYQINKRMQRAKELLIYSDLHICEISAEIGLDDALYFSKLFKKRFGCSPNTYRKNIKKQSV